MRRLSITLKYYTHPYGSFIIYTYLYYHWKMQAKIKFYNNKKKTNLWWLL